MRKVISYIITGLCILGAAAIILYTNFLSKEHYNDTYVNGNSAGNLYNNGLFCEDEDYIYFANFADNNQIYRMNKDGSEMKRISEDSAAFLNVDDNYIYYARTGEGDVSSFSFLHVNTHSLCKIRKDGRGEVSILDSDPVINISLSGNYLYYLHYSKSEGSTFYRIKIDGEEKEQIFPQPYFTCNASDRYIYYNGLEKDHNIYEFNTATYSQSLLYEGNCWMPVIEGGSAYFMDCDHNYQLAKVDLATKEKTILTTDRVDCFNLHNGTVYFQRNNNPALCSVRTDGSNYTEIKSGIYTDLNIAGNKLYFKEFENDMYYQFTISSGSVLPFVPSVQKSF